MIKIRFIWKIIITSVTLLATCLLAGNASASATESAAAAACFVDTIGQSVPGVLIWILVIFTVAVVITHWRTAKKHSTPVESFKEGQP